MCVLSCRVASRCRHPLTYYYDHCKDAPYPDRCQTDTSTVDAYEIDNETPFCKVCWATMKEQMYDEFHEERREITKLARRDNMDDTEISMIRKILRDQFYERLKYANKPLPALPNGSRATSSTDMKKPEKETIPKTLYTLGGNAPIEVRDQGKRIRVSQEKWPRGPI